MTLNDQQLDDLLKDVSVPADLNQQLYALVDSEDLTWDGSDEPQRIVLPGDARTSWTRKLIWAGVGIAAAFAAVAFFWKSGWESQPIGIAKSGSSSIGVCNATNAGCY